MRSPSLIHSLSVASMLPNSVLKCLHAFYKYIFGENWCHGNYLSYQGVQNYLCWAWDLHWMCSINIFFFPPNLKNFNKNFCFESSHVMFKIFKSLLHMYVVQVVIKLDRATELLLRIFQKKCIIQQRGVYDQSVVQLHAKVDQYQSVVRFWETPKTDNFCVKQVFHQW